MTTHSPFRFLPLDAPEDCAEREVLREFAGGKRTQESAMTEIARLTGEKTNQYPLRLYPPLASSVQTYVAGRLAGSRAYDKATARELGEWFYQTMTARTNNDSSVDELAWAMGYCDRAGLREHVRRLQEKLDQFQKLQFPYTLYLNTLRVKQMDARDREKS